MDSKQLDELVRKSNDQFLKLSNSGGVKLAKRSNFTKVKKGDIGDILRQRHSQRTGLFRFSLGFVAITTFFVLFLIGAQAYLNFHGYERELVNGTTLQIIVSGIFVQFVGLVGIITKSIWNDKPYLDAGVIEERKRRQEQEKYLKTER